MNGYKKFIKEVQDFPIEGVNFKDISPLLADGETFRSALVDMGRRVRNPDYWIGIDSRGYLFSSGLATYFGGGVICARKEGKTAGNKISISYDLEYGSATLEMQEGEGQVVIVDDVLATGGTARGAVDVLLKGGYEPVSAMFVAELDFLSPELPIPHTSIIHYDK